MQRGGGGKFPGQDLIQKYFDQIRDAKVGDPSTPFARLSVSTKDTEKLLNDAVEFMENSAACTKAMSVWFSRDNVGLPGIALFFKIYTQSTVNDIWVVADFMTKRGEHFEVRPTSEHPSELARGKDESDVLHAFEKALAMSKACAEGSTKLWALAQKNNDPHLSCKAQECADADACKVKMLSHYVSHLKLVAGDKHAIKEFDRRLPFEINDWACAVGIDAALPARLMCNSVLRAEKWEKEIFEHEPNHPKDLVRREIFKKVV
jgi:ferritin heavy chain